MNHLSTVACSSMLLLSTVASSMLQVQQDLSENTINAWVIDPLTQQITSYSTGHWVNSYAELSGFTVPANLQVLVNGLPNSSVPMSPMQAGISIIGLGQADQDSASYAGTNQLVLTPASMVSKQSIKVQMKVDPELLVLGPTELRWQINGGALSSLTITPFDATDDNAFVTKHFYLVNDGAYHVQVGLYQSGVLISEALANYQITSDHPLKEKRDSDGDGVPDLIEAELGLDPFDPDLFKTSSGQQWSKFDIWLRCDAINISQCSLPEDTDGDGWSDFDEALRGTRVDDFILTPPVNTEPDEQFNRNKLALQERPAARRLYEVEYLLQGSLGSDKIEHLQAAELNGIGLFTLEQFVTSDLLNLLGVSPDALEPKILYDNAVSNMRASSWPHIRIAAGKTLAIRGHRSIDTPNQVNNPSQSVSLIVLPGQGDVDIRQFPSSLDGSWTNAQEWRDKLKVWLKGQIVKNISTEFSYHTDKAGLLFEAALKEEARLAGYSEDIRLGQTTIPLMWINDLKVSMQRREDSNLFAWYDRLLKALTENPAYQALSLATDNFINALPATATNTSAWLIERLRMPVDLEQQGCYIDSVDLAEIQADPEFFAQYTGFCPQYYTEIELNTWHQQAKEFRYLLRMTVFDEGATRISESMSLSDVDDDSDNDSLQNIDEVLRSAYDLSTYPWRLDSDADGIADNLDDCRYDAQNLCSSNPIEPLLALGDDVQLNISSQGGIVLLELVLSAPAREEISFSYFIEASTEDGDTATDGTDFIASSGTLQFEPGQQSLLIPASVLSSEENSHVQFRIRIEDLVNANLASNDNVQVVNITRDVSARVDILLADTTYTIDERSSLSFDASESQSGIENPNLSFTWSQLSGPTVALINSSSATPSFTAPVTQNPIELVFSVTATNADGEQATASVNVNVNPVDDPPVIISEARFSVARDGVLSINKDDLLQFVSEPDGETLMLTELVETVTSGGTLLDSALTFEFLPDSGSTRQVQDLPDNPLNIRQWINEGITFRTANTSADPREFKVYTWTPNEGLQVVAENNTGYSNIITNLEQQILFYARFNSETSSDIFEWVLPTGERGSFDTGGFASLFGAQINAQTGELYHCMSEQWQRLNPFTGEHDSIALECSRFSAAQAQIDGQFCLTGGDGLHCSEDGLNFSTVFTLPDSFASIDRIFQNGEHVLILYNDSINQYLVEVDGQENGQLLSTLGDYFNQIQGHWFGDSFYTVLPVIESFLLQGVQLHKWTPGTDQLEAIGEPQLMAEFITRSEFNSFLVLGDSFLWQGQKDSNSYARYIVDPVNGIFTQVSEEFSLQRNLFAWRDTALVSSARSEISFCDYFELALNGEIKDPNNPELSQISCFGNFIYGDTLAYQRFDNELGINKFAVKYGSGALDSVQFVVRITDQNNNAVDLTVVIDITEGEE